MRLHHGRRVHPESRARQDRHRPIQFNTSAYNGPVFKTITVSSNDKKQPTFILQLKGTVWKPIETVPQYTVLNVPPDNPSASVSVQITNHLDEPLEVYDLDLNTTAVSAELKTNEPGKSFTIKLTAVPQATGNMSGRIALKTSVTNMPTLDIPFWVNVQPAIAVLPPQVYLPQAPLANASTPSVNIQNNSSTLLTLSDPAVNIPGVDARIREINPGHTYSVVFSFPAGFEVPQGQHAMFTVKSSHPQFPVIKIPIMQAPRPAMAPVPGAPNNLSRPTALSPVPRPGQITSAPEVK